MKAALDILESKKDGLRHGSLNVQHTPISARLKDKSKALRTLRRRQEDRKQLVELKRLVEARQESWHEYCKIWNMEDKEYEAEPFTSIEQMFTAMHDLAGIRISVYFPNDVQKVVDFLDEKFHIVDGPSRKGGMTRDFQKVRKLVERQRQMKDAPEDRRIGPAVESTFAGYRATHVVIQHKSLDFDEHARGDRITNIEIQIGSIIMHAWSDIEHDILYKPSGAGETSPDVVRMLDLINGIVMTGEVALQQLASVAAAEATRQAEDRTQQAMNWQYMVPWLDRYFNDRKIPLPPRNEWLSMRFLFEILKATDDHTFGRVEELLEEMDPKPDERLPVMMLHHIGRETYPFEDRGFEPFNLATTWNARYWATCLVNALNLAIFMSSSPNLYRTMWYYSKEVESIHNYRPTFAEFLDILHPTKPRRRTDRESRMIDFCKRVLSSSSKCK
ncbi:uncharacterized protein CTRU02_206270 [Colletotrichum truncatum]|uniref:Uncharacterized protein n=1 Tax=Colletotrichum truncatum TaxID=5467 RepID=A0ACC3Z6P3_COLTU|nr:uncharacterized protein CTRU02_09891 [Colletotrichum truncatum]KAF6788078.1 hypothetical protein CTRU02_09891 [Colletotrichum truncatum]